MGLVIGSLAASSSTIKEIEAQVPDAKPVADMEGVIVARGAAWFLLRGRLCSVVLIDVDGRPGTPERMRDLVRAILARA